MLCIAAVMRRECPLRGACSNATGEELGVTSSCLSQGNTMTLVCCRKSGPLFLYLVASGLLTLHDGNGARLRQLHSQANSSSAPLPKGLPAPVGHRQPTESSTPTPTLASPAPAVSSRPPSTNEPPIGADSTLKELERVEADAQNARASEATVRGNLASAQAELQRTKEELQRTKDAAARATPKKRNMHKRTHECCERRPGHQAV